MTPFQINMARGLVLPTGVRKRWYRWLLLYILVATAVCGTAARQALDRIAELNKERASLAQKEFRFQSSRKQVRDMGLYASRLQGQLDDCLARLEAINRFQTMGHRTAPVFLGIAMALPRGMNLGRFEMTGGSDLKFDIDVPAGRHAEGGISPTQLIALWGQEPLLKGRIETYKTDDSERVEVGNQSVLSWRFTAALAGEP